MFCETVKNGQSLSYYLEEEQRLAREFASLEGERRKGLFFVWQSPPTVICGHNQVVENEVDLAFCREKGIAVVQRRSGGGAVYSDAGNVMLSFVLPRGPVEKWFPAVLGAMAEFLRSLGLNAEVTGHNDILVDGRKVSGNAFFQAPGASIVHGTMLFDVDFAVLERVLTPPKEKLERHGVASVRARVANLKPLLEAAGNPMDLPTFLSRLAAWFRRSTYILDY